MLAKTCKAFTLIEMLVVISVIALLMAILMPTLVLARSHALAIVCRSNLRQLVLANIGYATENDGFYVPAASDIWNNDGLCRWHGVRTNTTEPFVPTKGPLASYLGDGQVKECPSITDFVKGFEAGCGGYGYNMTYLGSRYWNPPPPSQFKSQREFFEALYGRTAKFTEVAKPAETLMFADCAMSKSNDILIEYSFTEPPYFLDNGRVAVDWGLSSPSIHFRHREFTNAAWTDGHIDDRQMAQSKSKNAYGANCKDNKLGWFSPVDNSLFDLE